MNLDEVHNYKKTNEIVPEPQLFIHSRQAVRVLQFCRCNSNCYCPE
jgi:hypothetical protein